MDSEIYWYSIFSSFLGRNWGDLASVLGVCLTVYFSWRAKRSADLAKEAAQSTKSRLQSIDLLVELNRLHGRVDDLNLRIDGAAWPIVNERATDLRVSIAAIVSQNDLPFSKEVIEKLSIAVNQFKNMAATADKAIASPNSATDSLRLRRVVSDQKETIVLALQEIKTSMGES